MKYKHFVSFILAICVFGVPAQQAYMVKDKNIITVKAEELSYGNVNYEVISGGITITGCSSTTSALEIPDTIDELPVISIAKNALALKPL